MASNHKKDIDQVFKTKLEDHSSKVPASVWGKISAELDQQSENGKPGMEPRNRKFNISGFARIAAGLLLFGFIIWKVQPDQKASLTAENKSANEPIQSVAKNEKEISIEKEILVDPAEDPVSPVESQTGSVSEEPSVRIADKRLAYHVERAVPEEENEEAGELIESVVHASVYQPVSSQPQRTVEETLAMKDIPETEIPVPELEAFTEIEEPAEALASTSEIEDESDNPDVIVDSRGSRSRERPKILSGVLNFVANNLQVGGSSVVEFSETDQGILQVDMKGLFDK